MKQQEERRLLLGALKEGFAPRVFGPVASEEQPDAFPTRVSAGELDQRRAG